MINIGLLGCGTVGSAVVEISKEQKEFIKKALGREINISKILVKNLENYKDREDFNLFTDDVNSIVEDVNIDIIIELTGNIDEIYPAILRAMENEKNVVTANKAMISRHMEDLISLAKEKGVKFCYDASVAGAIPIIETVKNISDLNEIKSVKGVLNGTCNFILSSMESGKDYQSALLEAQAIGYAEADPTDDVEGFDTMRKLRILSTLAFKEKISEDDIKVIGISGISMDDVENLKENNERFKLVATAYKENGKVVAFVEPTIVKKDSILGGLVDGENAVVVEGDNCGELVFKGPGAGGRPTAFSILSDVLNIYKA